MDWTMVGALGEVLGAVGVIATLAYLATQIRQGNVAARQEAIRETLDLSDRFLRELSSSPQVSRVFLRGLSDDSDLTPDELGQFYALLLRQVFLWQRVWEFGDLGADYASRARLEIVGSRGFRRWFDQRGHWLDERFRAQLMGEIEASPGFVAPWSPRTPPIG